MNHFKPPIPKEKAPDRLASTDGGGKLFTTENLIARANSVNGTRHDLNASLLDLLGVLEEYVEFHEERKRR